MVEKSNRIVWADLLRLIAIVMVIRFIVQTLSTSLRKPGRILSIIYGEVFMAPFYALVYRFL